MTLRASFDDDLQNNLFTDVGSVAPVQALVFHSREAASDTAALDIVWRAGANVIRLWSSPHFEFGPRVERTTESRLRF